MEMDCNTRKTGVTVTGTSVEVLEKKLNDLPVQSKNSRSVRSQQPPSYSGFSLAFEMVSLPVGRSWAPNLKTKPENQTPGLECKFWWELILDLGWRLTVTMTVSGTRTGSLKCPWVWILNSNASGPVVQGKCNAMTDAVGQTSLRVTMPSSKPEWTLLAYSEKPDLRLRSRLELWSRSWHGWFLEQSFLVRNLFYNDTFVDVLFRLGGLDDF